MSDNLPDATSPTSPVGPAISGADLDSVIEGVRSVVEIIGQNSISRLKLDYGALQVEVEYAAELPATLPPAPLSAAAQSPQPVPALQSVPAPLSAPEAGPAAGERPRVHVNAPLVGVFYRAQGPGKAPFVESGQRVEAGEQVAIIEAMKMMNSVLAECSGTVVDILAIDGDVVEYEQALIAIEPN